MKLIKAEKAVTIVIVSIVAFLVSTLWFTMFHTRILPVELKSRDGIVRMHSSRYVHGFPGVTTLIVLVQNTSDSKIDYANLNWTAADSGGVVISAGWTNSFPPLDPGQFGEVRISLFDMPSEAVKLRLYFSLVRSGGRTLSDAREE